MFPHVNLCPLLERHLRPRAETKGLITPDAAAGAGEVCGREGGRIAPHRALRGSSQLLFCYCCWGFFSPLPFSILTTQPWMKSLGEPRSGRTGRRSWGSCGGGWGDSDSPAARGVLWVWGIGLEPALSPVLRGLRSPKYSPGLRLRRLGPPANPPNSPDIPRSRCARK